MKRKKILLGHLNSMGDCLFATVIARQIKEIDFPGCHLTWAVGGKSKPAMLHNPYVDALWEIPLEKNTATIEEWENFVAEAGMKKQGGDFDEVFLTQIIGDNLLNYDGGIRSSTYNNYPHPISVAHQPTIRLTDAEVENVRQFAERNELPKYKRVILIEFAPDSFATALNLQTAIEFAGQITAQNTDAAVILSSNKVFIAPSSRIIDASELSFRENAELTKYCDLFIGCASGISWLTTTDWAKKLEMILLIKQENYVLPSMIYDHEYLDLPTGHIIEIRDGKTALKKLNECAALVFDDGFAAARRKFNEKIKPANYQFLENQIRVALKQGDLRKSLSCVRQCIRRNGGGFLFSAAFLRMIYNLHIIFINKILKTAGLKTAADRATD